MHSNFSEACKKERELIQVPPLPLAAIRAAAANPSVTEAGRRRRGLIVGLLAGVSIVAAAAAAEILSSTHISLTPKGAVRLSSTEQLSIKTNPSAADISAAVRGASFPVTLPAGVPGNTKPIQLLRLGKSAIFLAYTLPGAWRGRGSHLMWIILANPQDWDNAPVSASAKQLVFMLKPAAHPSAHWRAGGEDVIISAFNITPAELARMKAAMHATSLSS